MTRSPDAAAACALEAAALSLFADPGAALLLLVDIGVAQSLCAAGATAIEATAIAVSVRRQWARLQSAQLRREPITAAAVATTPTATGSARTTERRDALAYGCSKPMMKSSAWLPVTTGEEANDQVHRRCARTVRCVLRTVAVNPASDLLRRLPWRHLRPSNPRLLPPRPVDRLALRQRTLEADHKISRRAFALCGPRWPSQN